MNIGQTNLSHSARLASVVMPLVRLLDTDGLSWSEREQIAAAIRNTMRVHADMEKERVHLSGALDGSAAARAQFQKQYKP